MSWKRLIFFIWCAMTLVTLFFYPLISTLHDDLWYLQWSRRDTYEFALAYIVFAILMTVVLWGIGTIRQTRLKYIALFFVGLIPVMSFGIQVVRQLGLGWLAVSMAEGLKNYLTPVIIALIFVGVVGVALLKKKPRFFITVFGAILLILSPINVLVIWTIIKTPPFHELAIRKQLVESVIKHQDNNVYIFLFDEMSYNFLYDKNGVIRPGYPNIAALSDVADNYHDARGFSTSTLHSVPAAIFNTEKEVSTQEGQIVFIDANGAVRRLQDNTDNLFSKAKTQGYAVGVFGPYFRYCEMLQNYVDLCNSYSIYNYSTVHGHFSLLNPIITNLILWPRQMPYGLLKRPLFALWQKSGIENTYNWTIEAISIQQPLFLFTHFYIPHLPFVFDRNGFKLTFDPLEQSDEHYQQQLEYVDTLIGNLVQRLKDEQKFENSFLLLISDHNFRIKFPDQASKVVIILKHPQQSTRNDIQNKSSLINILQTLLP